MNQGSNVSQDSNVMQEHSRNQSIAVNQNSNTNQDHIMNQDNITSQNGPTQFAFRHWITDGTGHPFYARKNVMLPVKPEKATAMVCGLGQFNFYINGRKVGDHVLDPAWTDYKKLVYYVTFDITDYLQEGENVLACEVGNGWYLADQEGGYFFHFPSFMPPNPNPYQPFDKELVLGLHADIVLPEQADNKGKSASAASVHPANNAEGAHVNVITPESASPSSHILTVDTDASWLVHPHEILHSNCYGSEVIDHRREAAGWNAISLPKTALQPDDDSATAQPHGDTSQLSDRITKSDTAISDEWTNAQIADNGEALNRLLSPSCMPPVRVIRTYPGKYLGTVNGHAIYDFGQNCSGMLSFEAKGKAGEVIHALPAEKLTSEGDVDQMAKNWVLIDVKETCILGSDDTWESFAMTFTYFGGRYVALDTAPENVRNLELHAISSAAERAGTFECDDPRYLQIYDLIEKAVEANMVSVHTDCPTIERFAWQEENHLMAPAIMYMKSVKPHWAKFLRDTRLAQLTKEDSFNDLNHGRYYPGDGLIPSQAPCYIPNVLPVPGLGDFYNVIGWGSSIILGTWWHYQFYGDKKIIEDNYEAGKKYLSFLKTCVNEDGFINNGLGDWGNPTGEYAKENVETAFLYADTTTLEKFARILGKDADACCLQKYAKAVRDNYNEKLLVRDQETGRYCYKVWGKESLLMTQAAEAMPLFWGMVPDDRIDDVVESFREVLQHDGSLRTGEVAQPYIIQTMSRYGMNDMLCDMILKPEHPSYYAFVLAGETTLGEYWEENPRSHCHDMMGHIAEWYYNGIAGIRPLAPGFGKVLIRPYLPKTMHHMKATYHSASGSISVEMNRQEDGSVRLEVEAAPDMEVTIDRSQIA